MWVSCESCYSYWNMIFLDPFGLSRCFHIYWLYVYDIPDENDWVLITTPTCVKNWEWRWGCDLGKIQLPDLKKFGTILLNPISFLKIFRVKMLNLMILRNYFCDNKHIIKSKGINFFTISRDKIQIFPLFLKFHFMKIIIVQIDFFLIKSDFLETFIEFNGFKIQYSVSICSNQFFLKIFQVISEHMSVQIIYKNTISTV